MIQGKILPAIFRLYLGKDFFLKIAVCIRPLSFQCLLCFIQSPLPTGKPFGWEAVGSDHILVTHILYSIWNTYITFFDESNSL